MAKSIFSEAYDRANTKGKVSLNKDHTLNWASFESNLTGLDKIASEHNKAMEFANSIAEMANAIASEQFMAHIKGMPTYESVAKRTEDFKFWYLDTPIRSRKDGEVIPIKGEGFWYKYPIDFDKLTYGQKSDVWKHNLKYHTLMCRVELETGDKGRAISYEQQVSNQQQTIEQQSSQIDQQSKLIAALCAKMGIKVEDLKVEE